ncbi:MAG: hypothetical protein R3C68_01725 [Myxococcota bacterium]
MSAADTRVINNISYNNISKNVYDVGVNTTLPSNLETNPLNLVDVMGLTFI